MDFRLLGSTVLAAVLATSTPAKSADLGGAPPLKTDVSSIGYSPWKFSFTTYGWLSWVTGDLTVKGRTVGVDASPKDLINALDWEGGLPIWMSYAEARNGRLILFNDIIYSRIAAAGSFAASRQGALGTQSFGGSVETDYKQATIELGAAYEIWASGITTSSRSTAFDLLAGARYWYQEVNLSADLTATLALGGGLLPGLTISGNRAIAKSGSVDWLDPFIGARMRHAVAPGHQLTVRGDVGGFGVGSDFSWHAIATYDWRMYQSAGYSIDAYLGYKALYADYTKGQGTTKYEYDMLQHGPVVGLAVRF